MRCTKSLLYGAAIFTGLLVTLGSLWVAMKTSLPVLDHPLMAMVIVAVCYVAMEKSVTYLAKKRSWSC
ncbi:hypothetical protein CQS04_11755 [Chryseomicrobium excrementi]|uniref:Uncharacterized protein n=1 Tax=Chryseomicrobium excrementi TaxID=2041346 RepID=A0A2M9EXG3_9BACL|nr:hypothetical protein [Chryseomicrobium excrementi]PJK15903.1 hypothetical protein CQS04_11755 [Chryseomicrobium excrementi]